MGAGAPGAVEFDKGIVTEAPNLRNWSRVPMREILERALGVPAIVENDVNLAILGERWRGAAKGHHTCVYITVGTGIGAGIIVGRRAPPRPPLHGRGDRLHVHGPAVHRLGRRPAAWSRWPASRPWPSARPAPRGATPQVVADLLEAAGNGDRAARKAVTEAAILIGMAVANLAVVVDPSLIVVAGAMVTQSELLVQEVRRVVSRVVPASPRDRGLRAGQGGAALGLPAGGGQRGPRAPAPPAPADRAFREGRPDWRDEARGRDPRRRRLRGDAPGLGPREPPAAATVQERLGHPATARLLVIHADDLGMAHSVNRATFEALRARLGHLREHPGPLSVVPGGGPLRARPSRGRPRHPPRPEQRVDDVPVGPGEPAGRVRSLLDPDGYFPLLETTVAERALPEEAERELRAQVERARAAGVRITHLDSHMGALYGTAGLLDVYRRLAGEYRVPLRWDARSPSPREGSMPRRGDPHRPRAGRGPGRGPQRLARRLREDAGAAAAGVYEMVVHLAYSRRGDVGRHRGPSGLGRRLAPLRPGPRPQPRVPRVPARPGLRARGLEGPGPRPGAERPQRGCSTSTTRLAFTFSSRLVVPSGQRTSTASACVARPGRSGARMSSCER